MIYLLFFLAFGFPGLLLVWFFDDSAERNRKLRNEIRRLQLSPEVRAKEDSKARDDQVCHWLLVAILAVAIGIIAVVAFHL
jgi:hypothetical protein